ncbi:MAG: right-handed parallel beta-helix repeat-containing protein [Armatimonadetes bacterium]|nr:right-handed parallel beta-helix repeat-containing protein [Armatimonadota bacterium]
MKTVRPTDGMVIRESARLEPGTYLLSKGISIGADGVHLEAAGVTLVGSDRDGRGVQLVGRTGVRIHGLSLSDYYHGIYAEDCAELSISKCRISSTAEVAPNTTFLDIWLPPEEAYGSGLCFIRCEACEITQNDVQHQMNGLLIYYSKRLIVARNQCNYNSGFGIHLYSTCDSVFEENSCDYCCRFEPRKGGLHFGHMGADAAGFLAVMNSCRNKFIRNTARLGGDGFFLAGLAPDGTTCGCDENVFEENDASLSPNIAFEATFSQGNIFRRNFADRCNFGFWLGFSKDFILEDNRIIMNRQAGIAVENGVGMKVKSNQFQANGHGILLWSRYLERFAEAYPDRDTSRDWLIENNRFLRNGVGIRIAADQDHGTRPLDDDGKPRAPRPHSHKILHNDIQDNRVGIELHHTDRNIVRENTLNANVEANIRVEDCDNNEIANNLGSRGAYL